MDNNARITDIWFDNGRIFMRDASNIAYSRPLEAFPLLLDASDSQRRAYTIDPQGDAVRWPAIDEDIHISSFFEHQEPNKDNEVAKIFLRFPQLNVSDNV